MKLKDRIAEINAALEVETNVDVIYDLRDELDCIKIDIRYGVSPDAEWKFDCSDEWAASFEGVDISNSKKADYFGVC